MAKNFPYFKFLATDWMTGNIVFESLSTQGLFINICALYWQRDGLLMVEDINKRYKNPEELKNLTGAFLTINDVGLISINFLDEQLVAANHVSTKNSENGKKSAVMKALKTVENSTTAQRPLSETQRPLSETQQRKEKERKEKEIDAKNSKLFTPPILNDLISYFRENGYSEFSAKKAFDYYSVADWKDSKGNKVKNWKQKMQGVWFKPENKIFDSNSPIKMVY